jgi:DNA-binding NarL/FixJ family response regulator
MRLRCALYYPFKDVRRSFPEAHFAEANVPKRLLVVDDSAIIRTGVRTLLSDQAEWEICAEAANGLEAVLKVQQEFPDVVLLDLTMPVMNGFEAAVTIKEIAPATKVIFFSMHQIPSSPQFVGVEGFVSKQTAADDLLPALYKVTIAA